MLDAPQMMDAIEQILENYRRCGLRRIDRQRAAELPEELLHSLRVAEGVATYAPQASGAASTTTPTTLVEAASAAAAETTGSAGTGAHDAVPPAPALPASGRPRAQPIQPPAAAPVSIVSATEPWSLPVLSRAERERRLADVDQCSRACRLCVDIVSFRKQTVFGKGELTPRVVFMGEAPGADEDRTGEPFVGKAGQLLTKIIEAMKLTRDEVYILNALKCRPPQNRTPDPVEINNCRPFVEQQLDILQPQYIVCLGAVAVRSILRSDLSIGRLRGGFHNYRGAKVVVTYHPSYLLRNQNAKRMVWDDMQMLMKDAGLG